MLEVAIRVFIGEFLLININLPEDLWCHADLTCIPFDIELHILDIASLKLQLLRQSVIPHSLCHY